MLRRTIVISVVAALLVASPALSQVDPPKDPRDNVGHDPRDKLDRQPSHTPNPNRLSQRLGKNPSAPSAALDNAPQNDAYVSTAPVPVQREPVPGSSEMLDSMGDMEMYQAPSASAGLDSSLVPLPGMSVYHSPSTNSDSQTLSGATYPTWWPQ